MNLMQESANRNAEAYGIGTASLQAKGVGWMLMRFGLTVAMYPTVGQTITLVTYPTAVAKFFVYRDFRVLDAAGTLLAWATSTWLVFDTLKRSLIPVPPFIRELTPPVVVSVLPQLPTKPTYQNSLFESADTEDVTVGWFDIDSNQHVNNVVYIRWLLEQLPNQQLETQELARLDVVYKNETHWRERIQVQHQPEGPGTLVHRLVEAKTGKEVLLAQTVWRSCGGRQSNPALSQCRAGL
jgi:acyl-ACP thioesterase